MDLYEYLSQKKNTIVKKWVEAIVDRYPRDAGKLFIDVKDQFANPFGHTLKTELPVIFDELIEPENPEVLTRSLESIIRIRAVQDHSPSEAAGFLFLIKDIVRNEKDLPKDFTKILEFETRIDRAVAGCFDIYMQMKLKIYEIKANEKRRTFGKMVDKINRKYGLDESD